MTCPNCENGLVDVLDREKVNSQTISPPYKKEKCEVCGGSGEIEEHIIFSSVEVKLKSGIIIANYKAEKWGGGVNVEFDGGDIENLNNISIDKFEANDIRKAVNQDAERKLNED